ncbi:MAG: hypothetical protein SF028_06435 [Candidatus Sumerlaeia bacterium]|nr:hypothetical protein [Candidatus Sumerlaeia bacterium]
MSTELTSRFTRAFALTHDLVAHLDEAALGLDLPGLPSNRIGGQLWCIVGARESYLRAIASGCWQGFNCSLRSPQNKQSVLEALEATSGALHQVDAAGLMPAQLGLALDLLEHEVQHHGQLIRFVYANRLTFPASWKERYTV